MPYPCRNGGADPSYVSLPLHEAWAVLLEGYLPHLLAEAEGAAACLLLRKGDLERAGEHPCSRGMAGGGGRSGKCGVTGELAGARGRCGKGRPQAPHLGVTCRTDPPRHQGQ